MERTSQRTHAVLSQRHRRVMRWALGASILLHVLVLFMFRHARPLPPSPFAAAGPRAGDDRAAAGGGMQVVALRVALPAAQPEKIVRPPEPIPTPDVKAPPQIEPRPHLEAAAPSITQVTGTLAQGLGKSAGPGLAEGTGKGDGGTDTEGRFRLVPPSPRGLILPPSERPGKVKGKEIEVWVFVTVAGKVLADSTRLAPSTGDHGFDERLRKEAAEWSFEPARRGGRAVAEWFRYTIIL